MVTLENYYSMYIFSLGKQKKYFIHLICPLETVKALMMCLPPEEGSGTILKTACTNMYSKINFINFSKFYSETSDSVQNVKIE